MEDLRFEIEEVKMNDNIMVEILPPVAGFYESGLLKWEYITQVEGGSYASQLAALMDIK